MPGLTASYRSRRPESDLLNWFSWDSSSGHCCIPSNYQDIQQLPPLNIWPLPLANTNIKVKAVALHQKQFCYLNAHLSPYLEVMQFKGLFFKMFWRVWETAKIQPQGPVPAIQYLRSCFTALGNVRHAHSASSGPWPSRDLCSQVFLGLVNTGSKDMGHSWV